MDRAFGLDIPATLDEVCHPDRTALIVYDMQVGIVSQVPAGSGIVERVGQVLQAAREGGLRVFFTRHMSLPNTVCPARPKNTESRPLPQPNSITASANRREPSLPVRISMVGSPGRTISSGPCRNSPV